GRLQKRQDHRESPDRRGRPARRAHVVKRETRVTRGIPDRREKKVRKAIKVIPVPGEPPALRGLRDPWGPAEFTRKTG
ncbi:hypothetical protein ACQJM5_005244, partial [Escherichia coli]